MDTFSTMLNNSKPRRKEARRIRHTYTTREGHVYTFWRKRGGGTEYHVSYAGGYHLGSASGWTNIGVKAFRAEREAWDCYQELKQAFCQEAQA